MLALQPVVAETQYTYDTAGRLTRERRNDWNQNVDYQLDASGNRTRITWPDAFYAAYVYDGLGRVTSVATPALTLRTCTYENRPLDALYPLAFFDAIRVKTRDSGIVLSMTGGAGGF